MLQDLKKRSKKSRYNILKPINSRIMRNKFLMKYWNSSLYFLENDKSKNKFRN
jgi:hypothetical protein